MTQERLTRLAIANINIKEKLTVVDVIQKFTKNLPKRMQLIDWTN
jgi:hypothetical protein